MLKVFNRMLCITVACLFTGATPTLAENVIEDGSIGMSLEELAFLIDKWTPEMKNAAANDPGDRVELLSQAIANKKVAAQVENIDPASASEAYWRHIYSIRNMDTRFVTKQFVDSLEMPDFEPLAQERYQTEKKKYAFVAEERIVSHILIMCGAPACSRDERRPEAESILAELQRGANFEELVAVHSEDPGSKAKGGRFDRWFRLGEPEVSPHFTGGAFEIENVGDYSGLVESQFGFHIIRLDDVRPEHYKAYEDVKDVIVASLRKEFVELSTKDFYAGFRMTGDAVVDDAALDELLAPYKSE
ncbi:MAG: peptidylprolyl isomerase [Halieaceae bacterium]